MKKIIVPLVLLILTVAVFLSVTLINNTADKINPKNSQNSDSLILGFSQIGSESAWRTRNTQSIFEAAAQNNIQIIYDDAQQKQSNQLKAIRSFIVYQVDVIAFVPIVEDGWDNVLQEAKDANIPVIIVDRQINADPSLYAGFLGEDGFEEGCSAGRFLVEKCKNENREINIIELAGTENSSIAMKRAEGFRSVILKDPKFNIMYSEDGDFLRSRGKEIMDNILEANNRYMRLDGKKIDVIYSHNDSMTLGILDSMKEKIVPFGETIIISIDGEQKSIDALTEGKLNCVVECNPNLGPELMKLVMKTAAGEKIPAITYTKEQIFTENDDFSTYTPRGY